MTDRTPDTAPARDIRAAYLLGLLRGFPFLLVIVPFGLLFGVSAAESGLPLSQIMGFSILVIAGAAQFTALQMMNDNAPMIAVLATSLAVNLRMAMYSASLAPHVGRAPTWKKALLAYFMADQPYAVAHEDYEANPARPLGGKLAIFFGAATPICGSWYVATLAGAVLGQAIPPEFALDFAVPITFLAIVAPLMRSLPHLVAAGVSVAGTLALSFVPNGMGLLIAALAAMAAGAQTETWLARRRARQS